MVNMAVLLPPGASIQFGGSRRLHSSSILSMAYTAAFVAFAASRLSSSEVRPTDASLSSFIYPFNGQHGCFTTIWCVYTIWRFALPSFFQWPTQRLLWLLRLRVYPAWKFVQLTHRFHPFNGLQGGCCSRLVRLSSLEVRSTDV
jgi:hypothetical protein